MSVWEQRDYPVLRYLHDMEQSNRMLETQRRSDEPYPDLPGLTRAEFHRAVETLEEAGFVSCSGKEAEGSAEWGGVWWFDLMVTGEGEQVLGEWPYFDALGDPETLASILERLADVAPTEEIAEDRRRSAKAIGALGIGARVFITGYLGRVARGEMHLPF